MIALLALVVGVVLGLVLQPTIPAALQPYLPIAVVAALDAVFGASRALLDGIFNDRVFVISFIGNVLVAALVVFLGRPARRRGTAVDRRRRRLLDPDLRQRRSDPPTPLPRVTMPMSTTDPQPTEPTEPASRARRAHRRPSGPPAGRRSARSSPVARAAASGSWRSCSSGSGSGSPSR